MLIKKHSQFLRIEQIYDILGYVGIGSSCLPILVCFIKLYKNKGLISQKILYLLAVFYSVFNLLIFFLFIHSYAIQNLVVNLFYIVEFVLLLGFYNQILFKHVWKNIFKLILLIYVSFLIFSLLNYDLNENFLQLGIFQKSVLIILSLLHLNKTFRTYKSLNVFDSPYFWINIGILFYNSSTIFVSIFENYLRANSVELYYLLWPIPQISGIIYYIFFATGIWKLKD
jgi:hypothetical protein